MKCPFAGQFRDKLWRPVSEVCSVCSEDIAYNLVIKHESLDTETAFLLARLGLDSGGWDTDTSADISPEVHNNAI